MTSMLLFTRGDGALGELREPFGEGVELVMPFIRDLLAG